MTTASVASLITGLLPVVLMLACIPYRNNAPVPRAWARFHALAIAANASTVATLVLTLAAEPNTLTPQFTGIAVTLTGAWMAVLVQFLGTLIGVFSSRYLQGEPGQNAYIPALTGVLAAVHMLLLADHWLVLIGAWAAVGLALQHLLCFYPDRPFALLAAHKKRVADRLADGLLLAAAALAWHEVGSGSLSDLWRHVESGAQSAALQACALCLAVAVVLRTALLPVHGWLIQVMEAPTPVSALLHAGVINLGGFVLIRFAPLLETASIARWFLVGMGLATAVLAGQVMLTRISIKVRLAWSTVAQMGFMVVECGLGLYSLALLHLIGHSIYKANAFLSSSGAVEAAKLRDMRGISKPTTVSLLVAPVLSVTLVATLLLLYSMLAARAPWPWWWSGVLMMAWAPLLWMPKMRSPDGPGPLRSLLSGAAMVTALVLATLIGHMLPFGVRDVPNEAAGLLTLASMVMLYAWLALLQARPATLANWRRWSYAAFYVDEHATRAALYLWPTRWTAPTNK